jgi:phosphoglycerate dehydrogenase-like enzyme
MAPGQAPRPVVGLACNRETFERDVSAADRTRLEAIADFRYEQFDRPTSWDEPPPPDHDDDARFAAFVAGLDAVVVCHGAPRVTADVMGVSPRLRFVGELEGDRFAQRIDVVVARERGIRAIDTTQGSSYPVAEWALAMMLIGLRNAGGLYRRLIAHERVFEDGSRNTDPGFLRGELTGKTVGLIGAGHIGRRLLELMRPFKVEVLIHDPYVPREVADIYRATLTSLENVLRTPDVVVCLAPITPATKGMLGRLEIGLLRPGAVFVNVSRGAIVDSEALIERLRIGDIVASLDVFEPEPIPIDSPIRDLPNAFITPHIAGVTAANSNRFFSLMVDELLRHFNGHETLYDLLPRTLANRRGLPPPAP